MTHRTRNRHRILPLIFAATFALFAPLLALGSTANRPPATHEGLTVFLRKADRVAAATWAKWHERNETYTELVSLDQR